MPASSPVAVYPYYSDNALDENYGEPLTFDDDDDGPSDAVLGVTDAADAYGGGEQLELMPSRVEKLTVAKLVDVRKLKVACRHTLAVARKTTLKTPPAALKSRSRRRTLTVTYARRTSPSRWIMTCRKCMIPCISTSSRNSHSRTSS